MILKSLLKKGENAIGAILGNGFYNAPINWTQSYGSPRFLGQIYITYTDGTEEIIVSDQTGKHQKVRFLWIWYMMVNIMMPGWNSQAGAIPDLMIQNGNRLSIRKTPEGKMKAHMSPTDRVMEKLAPVKIEPLENGKFRVDFGQEISGWLHLLNVKGEAGRKIDIKYICESPVGDNSYTLKGGSPESTQHVLPGLYSGKLRSPTGPEN